MHIQKGLAILSIPTPIILDGPAMELKLTFRRLYVPLCVLFITSPMKQDLHVSISHIQHSPVQETEPPVRVPTGSSASLECPGCWHDQSGNYCRIRKHMLLLKLRALECSRARETMESGSPCVDYSPRVPSLWEHLSYLEWNLEECPGCRKAWWGSPGCLSSNSETLVAFTTSPSPKGVRSLCVPGSSSKWLQTMQGVYTRKQPQSGTCNMHRMTRMSIPTTILSILLSGT